MWQAIRGETNVGIRIKEAQFGHQPTRFSSRPE
jgi:hypothetical protein